MTCKTALQRSAGILTGPYTYLDHLGVLCSLLDIPLFIPDEKTFALAQTFYPQLNAIHKEHAELTLDFLASHFDAIFESGRFWAMEMLPFFELFYGKKMRLIFCPHGNSDKGHSRENHAPQDISLFYGDHILNLLKSTGAADHIGTLVRTGNYRYPFYRKHQPFYDQLAETHVFSKLDKNRKTIFYAPTWQDGENPSSFFDRCAELTEQLPDDYNLLIKLHPFIEEFHPAHTIHILSKYEGRKNIAIINDFPPIYPLLAKSDIYLGDYSSIGYDFLAFEKPMYFLTPKNSQSLDPCGLKVPADANVYDFIQASLEKNQKLSIKRKKIYDYAFGEEINPETLKSELIQIIKNPIPEEDRVGQSEET